VGAGDGGHLAAQVQGGQGVAQGAADQELHRQVVHPPGLGLAVSGVARHPAARKLLARDLRDGMQQLGARR
jgi:hypothetical protein